MAGYLKRLVRSLGAYQLADAVSKVMAILLLGEQPRLFHLAGYIMVFAGVVIASRKASSTK